MKKGVSTDTLFLILNAKYSIMNKKSTALANAFDEAIQVKTQFIRQNGKLKMVRRKIKAQEIKPVSKQLFPISKERQ